MIQKSEKWQEFDNRLSKIFKHRSKTARRQNIECFRIYDNDLPSFPFVIEIYGQKVYVAEYNRRHGMDEETHELWLQDCLEAISEVLEISSENIYLRERKRMSHRQGQYEKIGLEKDTFTVQENGLHFIVNLTDYLDSGLFLDHRITRKMVAEESKGKRVLNLFCYTGSFSIYAAAAGAQSVTSVDLSKTYLQWAEDNFAANGLDKKPHFFVHADVTQYLKSLPANSFDLVVVDPPTFSNSKRMKDIFDVQRDHVELLNDILRATTKDGVVYFSTNYTKFELESEAIAASEIKDITKATTPFDFEGKLKRWCYKLKK